MLQFCWNTRRPRVTASFGESAALPPFCAGALTGNNKRRNKKAVETYFMSAPAGRHPRNELHIGITTQDSIIAQDGAIDSRDSRFRGRPQCGHKNRKLWCYRGSLDLHIME